MNENTPQFLFVVVLIGEEMECQTPVKVVEIPIGCHPVEPHDDRRSIETREDQKPKIEIREDLLIEQIERQNTLNRVTMRFFRMVRFSNGEITQNLNKVQVDASFWSTRCRRG